MKDRTNLAVLLLLGQGTRQCCGWAPAAPARRKLLQQTIVQTAAALLVGVESAHAASSTFPTNPLVNPVLEQIRIWDQDQADNIKYNGELEKGSAGNRGQNGAYPKLLVPILAMARDLEQVRTSVQDPSGYDEAMGLLKTKQFTKTEFKKTFNAFADNIYYSDPDRANLYLGGGATPKIEQSLAYLVRNDILTNIEDLIAELQYVQKTPGSDTADLKMFADQAVNSMGKYLSIVPPNELQQAQRLLATTN